MLVQRKKIIEKSVVIYLLFASSTLCVFLFATEKELMKRKIFKREFSSNVQMLSAW